MLRRTIWFTKQLQIWSQVILEDTNLPIIGTYEALVIWHASKFYSCVIFNAKVIKWLVLVLVLCYICVTVLDLWLVLELLSLHVNKHLLNWIELNYYYFV